MSTPGVSKLTKLTKRTHKKSRNGCATCKLRRVKCDELHPTCSNCSRRGTDCVYAINTNTRVTSSHDLRIDDGMYPFTMAPDPARQGSSSTIRHHSVPSSINSDNSAGFTHPNSFNTTSNYAYSNNNDNSLFTNQFDPAVLFQSPGSTESNFDDKSSLFSNISIPDDLSSLSSATPQSLIDPDIKSKMVVLASNNGYKSFPSYMDHTKINNKLLEYFTTVLCFKFSSSPEMARAWASSTSICFKFSHLFHMIASVSALSIYHDLVSGAAEDETIGFKNPQDYLLIDQMNYSQYLEVFNAPTHQDKTPSEIFSYLGAAMLQLYRYLLSPTTTVCDAQFYRITGELCGIFDSIISATHVDSKVSEAEKSLLIYYSPFFTPRVVPKSSSFFPMYLYSLCQGNYAASNSDIIRDYASFQEVMELEYQKGPVTTDCQSLQSKSDISDVIRLTINLLRREYILVYNDEKPEQDAIRVFTRWPSLVTSRFASLLSEHNERAMIIVAHYLALLGSLDFDNLLPRAALIEEVQKIDSILEDNWKPWLDLPKRVFNLLD